jgi:hypothetical protein
MSALRRKRPPSIPGQTDATSGPRAHCRKRVRVRTFRDDLEDLGAGLGVTDPVTGEVVVKVTASRPATKKQGAKTKTAKRTKRP